MSIREFFIALVLTAAFSCFCTRAYYLNKHEVLVSELNATYIKAKENQANIERELNDTIFGLLEESYERQLEIENLSAERAALIGRLRDPGDTSSPGNTTSNKSSGSDSKTTTGTELSNAATQFLLKLTEDADKVTEQLRLCQEFVRHTFKSVEQ